MKKIIIACVFVMFFVTSGWAAEDDMSTSSSESGSEQIAKEPVAEEPVEDTTMESSSQATAAEPAAVEPEQPKHGFGHKLLFYIPNRVLDVFDFVRLRVRVGPGLAVGARHACLHPIDAQDTNIECLH